MKNIEKTRNKLLLKYKIFAKFMLGKAFIEDEAIGTIATNGVDFKYAPLRFDPLPMAEKEFWLLHEVAHIFLEHPKRLGNRNLELANEAADYEANALLAKFFPVPEHGLYEEEFEGMYFEKIYDILDKRQKKQKKDGEGESNKQTQARKEGQKGKILPSPDAPKETTVKKLLQKHKQEVSRISDLLKKAGSTSPEMQAIDEFVNPKETINDALRSFIQVSITEDENWSKPNKNFIQSGYYLPSYEGDGLANIKIGVDESYSINEQELKTFGEAISGVLEEYDTEIEIIYFNTKITDIDIVQSYDLPLNFYCNPNGGTAYKPIFEYIKNSEKQPVCLVMFTDLECSNYPEQEPDYPVLWVVTGDRGTEPPFGETYKL
jgi:predicted metal-dependent peptidase